MNTDLQYTLRLKDQFSKTLQGAYASTSKLDSRMNKLSSGFNKLNAMVGVAIGGASIVGFGSAVIESLKNYEYFSASLRTMLHGDIGAAMALQGQLVNLAKTSPFNLTDVQDSSKQLLAYGFKAGEVVETLKTLGDVSAGVGAPIGDIAYLYGTLKTSGRVTLMDLRQFAGRGIPIYETLSKTLRKTGESSEQTRNRINKMVHEGKLGFGEIEKAFKSMTSEGGDFFKMMEDQSKTVGGKLSNLSDSWEQLKVNIGKSQSGIIAGTTTFVSDFVSKLNQIFETQNKLDQAFSNKGIAGYTGIQKFNNWLFAGSTNDFVNDNFTGQMGKDEALQRSMGGMYVNPSARSKVDALKSESQLLGLMQSYGKAFTNKEIDAREYQVSRAIFENALTEIRGNKSLFNSKASGVAGANEINKEGTGKGSTSIGSGTEVTGNRPQSLNINIENLVKEMHVNTTNLTEASGKVRAEVSKALLEAVNDINMMK
jgi:hypothetical protein